MTAIDGRKQLDGAFSDLFGTPVRALWVPSGTSANALALAALCPPHGGVVCHRDAHIQNDECGAPEFYTHGAKLLLGEGDRRQADARERSGGDRSDPSGRPLGPAARDLDHQRDRIRAGLYARSKSPRSVTWRGTGAGAAHGRRALRQCRCASRLPPADVTWRAGVDVLSFGFVKNGGMSAEALIFFKPELADATLYRRKRAGCCYPRAAIWRRRCWRCWRTTCG
jgi:threonine aldolase